MPIKEIFVFIWLKKITGVGDQMSAKTKKRKRDIEKEYAAQQFASKLRRLADCLENGNHFRIQIAGERITIPPDAIINIEHERGTSEEEVEFQIKWKLNL